MVQTVGVIGLGAMGMGAARALHRAGLAVRGYDVDPARTAALAQEGATAVASLAALGPVDVLVLFVATAAQAEAALYGADGAAARLPRGACLLLCATVPAEFARSLGARLAEAGILMLDAPVSGGPARAAEGALSVMASGPDEAFARAAPVLDAMARTVHRLGPSHGTGSTVKMVNQLLAGVHIAAAAEAMALGIRAGADPQTLYRVITASAGNSWMFENRVPHILAGDYTPLSAVSIFLKDLGIVLDSAKGLDFPTPMAATALQLFTMAAAAGLAREDDSAVIKVFQRLAGIALPEAAPKAGG